MLGLRGEGGRAAQCRTSVGQRKAGQDQRSSHTAAETCLSLWHPLRQSPASEAMTKAWPKAWTGKALWDQEPLPLPTTSPTESRTPPPPHSSQRMPSRCLSPAPAQHLDDEVSHQPLPEEQPHCSRPGGIIWHVPACSHHAQAPAVWCMSASALTGNPLLGLGQPGWRSSSPITAGAVEPTTRVVEYGHVWALGFYPAGATHSPRQVDSQG